MEIAEACWGEAKYSNWMAMNPASVQSVEIVAARLLARPILQEYDAFHMWTQKQTAFQLAPV